jgi:hypothetical protein
MQLEHSRSNNSSVVLALAVAARLVLTRMKGQAEITVHRAMMVISFLTELVSLRA